MDNINEIKKSNRKALPKFILIMIISLIFGGVVGFFSAGIEYDTLLSSLKDISTFFSAHIVHYAMLAVAIIMPIICVPMYNSAKKLLLSWDGEDEEIYNIIDKKLSIVLWISNTGLILSYFLIAASYSNGIKGFVANVPSFVIVIISFFAILFEAIIIQQKCVDSAKRTNPEKTVSIYDTNFQKKWFDSCDEAEKILIGKCASKAFNTTNSVCCILAIILAICALTFEIGFLPSFVVCLIWIINLSVYYKEALKYSVTGNKIS